MCKNTVDKINRVSKKPRDCEFIRCNIIPFTVVVLGFLIDFISGPVNSGFTSAVSILIVASQMTDMIGVSSAGSTLLEMTVSMYNDRHNFRPGDALLGLICIVVILLMRVSRTNLISLCSISNILGKSLRTQFLYTYPNTRVLIWRY